MFTRKDTWVNLLGTVAVAWVIFAIAAGDRSAPSSPSPERAGKTAAKNPSSLITSRSETDDAERQLIADLSRRPAGELLAEAIDDRVLVKALAAQLDPRRTLPGTAPAWEVAAHLANVAPDEYYRDVETLILQSDTDPAVLDVLVGDAHMRDESIKLPLFARITADPAHPAFGEAFTALQAYFDDHDAGGLEGWRAAALRYPQQTASSR